MIESRTLPRPVLLTRIQALDLGAATVKVRVIVVVQLEPAFLANDLQVEARLDDSGAPGVFIVPPPPWSALDHAEISSVDIMVPETATLRFDVQVDDDRESWPPELRMALAAFNAPTSVRSSRRQLVPGADLGSLLDPAAAGG